ncbi:MAG: 2OG-Fe(II) oxygenase [Alphaproteobacteria bacterium]
MQTGAANTGASDPVPPSASLDLARFAATGLRHDPFDHLMVRGFVRPEACAAIEAAFPRIDRGGSFPASVFDCDPDFTALLDELQGPAVTQAFAEKFSIDLRDRPTMVTLRGQSRAKDGRIHTDSRSKLITALIYLNDGWDAEGGRLRLLHGPDDISNYALEVTPERGTLLAFRCTENAYHGHKPFTGRRLSVQLNWLTDTAVLKRELARHSVSAWSKRLLRFARPQQNAD